MKKAIFTGIFLAAALFVSGQEESGVQTVDYAGLREHLRFDEQVVRGQLPNGLSYYILENDRPEEFIELHLAVRAGSLHEGDHEQGLAHLLEHMAFNGTEKYPGNSLIEAMERLGTSFGQDLNASTSFEQTVYRLQVEAADSQRLVQGLGLLEQWAAGIALGDDEIRGERGVVLEEAALRRRPDADAFREHISVLLAGSDYPLRFPIGREEVIRGAEARTLREFYQRWYRAERMAVVVVGAVDARETEEHIIQIFGGIGGVDITAPGDAEEPRTEAATAGSGAAGDGAEAFRVPRRVPEAHRELRSSYFAHPQITGNRIAMYIKEEAAPPPAPAETVEDYRRDLVFALFSKLFQQRVKSIIEEPDSPILSAQASDGMYRWYPQLDVAALTANFVPGRSTEAVTRLFEAVRVIELHGAHPDEFLQAREELKQDYKNYVQGYDTLQSRFFASRYVIHFITGTLPLGVESELALGEGLVDTISPQEIQDIASLYLRGENRVLTITEREESPGVAGFDGDAAAALVGQIAETAYNNVEDAAAGGAEELLDVSALTALLETPVPAPVYDERYDLYTWELGNGVEVVLRRGDFERDQVEVDMYSRGGSSLYGETEYREAVLSAEIARTSGLGELRPVELTRVLTGKRADISPYVGSYTEGLRGGSSPDDIETLGQLIYLWFSAPRYDGELVESWRDKKIVSAENGANVPELRLERRMQGLLADTARISSRLFDPEDFRNLDTERAFAIFRERFRDIGDFRLLVAGNIAPQELETLLRYVASVPRPAGVDGANASVEREQWGEVGIEYADDVLTDTLIFGEQESAITSRTYHGEFTWGLENNAELRALADLLSIRLLEEVREKSSSVYSISAWGASEFLPAPHYFLRLYYGSNPESSERILTLVDAEVANLKAGRIDSSYVERIKNTQLSEYRERRQSNSYWISTLRFTDLYGYGIDEALRREERINAISVDTLQESARKYLNTERTVTVTVSPEN